MPDMTKRPDFRARPPVSSTRRLTPARRSSTPDDRFFRHIVDSMRNGVLAIHRDGIVALMNDEAYRILALERRAGDIGRPLTEVMQDRPDIIRVLSGSFELSHLPNRAELRIKHIERVIGYTLSKVLGDRGQAIGAVMFFK